MSPTARMMTSVKLGLMAAILAIAVPGTAAAAGTNGKLVFASDRDAGDVEIYSMNADGSAQTRLTSSPGDDTNPVWSPSGTQIAFSSARSGALHIFRVSAHGGPPTQVTDGAGDDLEPTWSPDGKRIAFVNVIGHEGQIDVVNADGTGPVETLTNTPGINVDPVWSANGKIVFTSDRDGNEEIYVMDADGANQTRLTTDPADDSGPYWSPDGSRIAFQSARDGNLEIYDMDADGSHQRRLTNDPGIDTGAAWSPDGARIAFASDRDGDLEIYTLDPDTMDPANTTPTQLTNNLALDKFPDWQTAPTGGADVDPPTLTLPSNRTVDASSPAGATVSYTVSATDAVDPSPAVSCTPASGATFVIGVTTVRCTATDSAGNASSGSFSVTVRGAGAQLTRLAQEVLAASGLPQSLQQRLLTFTANLADPVSPLQRRVLCVQLTNFKLAIQGLRPPVLSIAQRDAWITDADRIRTVLGC